MYYVSNLLYSQNLPYCIDIISISVVHLLQGTFEKASLENLEERILQISTRSHQNMVGALWQLLKITL